MRNAIAHLFTPWEWRSRWMVIAMVAVVAAIGIVVLAQIATRPHYNLAATLLNMAVMAVVVVFGMIRPAVRTLRRWDEAHRASAPGHGPGHSASA